MTPIGGYLLDTNVLSHLLREPQGRVWERIADVGENLVFTSIVAASELRFGANKRGSSRLMERVDVLLAALAVAPLRSPADAEYAQLRQTLEASGRPIGPNDMLIAAHARAEAATLVTANVTEFQRVPGLHVVDWLS